MHNKFDKVYIIKSKITLIDEINVVILDNDHNMFSIFLGNIDSIFFNKNNKTYTIILMSGTTVDIEEETPGEIIYKIWLDYLNGNDDSDKLTRTLKHEWTSEE